MNKIDITLIKYTLILIFVGTLVAGILALVYEVTLVPINKYQKDILLASQKTVLPAAADFVDKKMSGDLLKKFKELYPAETETDYFIGQTAGQNNGVIFKVFPKGYGGPIKMLVGVDLNGKIAGLKILEQKETPGLGAHITDENYKNTKKSFVAQFLGKMKTDKIAPKADIDAITGATISTRAVCSGVRQALELFEIYKTKGG